jgi:hypothetical protein
MIKAQVHDKFKLFTGKLAADKTIGKLADEVAGYAAKASVAAKSIGVITEPGERILITLGYRDDADPYAIKLHSVRLGKFDPTAADHSALEKSMAAAAGRYSNIICHELYLTQDNDAMMVIMTHEA